MVRDIPCFLYVLVFTVCASASYAPTPPSPPHVADRAPSAPPVLLVSVDGMRPDYVLQADRYGLAIPNLRRFLEEGSYAMGVRGVAPTVTYPSHTTMLTGVSPSTHGIEANATFDPMDENGDGWRWYAADIKVPTLFDTAARASLTTASFYWPANVDAPATYRLVEYWRGLPSDDRHLVRALSSESLLDEMEQVLGKLPHGLDWSIEGDEQRARFVAYLLGHQRPSFTVFHMLALDEQQHVHGPMTLPVFATLERLDAVLGMLRGALEAANSSRAVMAVVSDHGFVRVSHQIQIRAALREAGLLTVDESGKISAWKAAATLTGGTVALTLQDPQDGASAQKVLDVIQRLSDLPEKPVRRVLDREALRRTGGFSSAAFVVELRPGFYFGSRLNGPLVVRWDEMKPPGYQGMHGYLPDDSEMNASFLLVGSGIPKKRALGLVDMRDIAPTLAALLHLSLPLAEGRNLL